LPAAPGRESLRDVRPHPVPLPSEHDLTHDDTDQACRCHTSYAALEAEAVAQRRLTRRGLMRSGAAVAGIVAATQVFEPAAADVGTTSTRTFTGNFDGLGGPDWVYLPFQVPDGVQRLDVSYAYTKLDTGLGFSANVIDIGIFGPAGYDLGNAEGFRGWSGGARKSFTISDADATPGYIPGPITPGVWNINLGPFIILPPGVGYTVTVTLTYGAPLPAFVPSPAPRSVPGKGAGWYRGDLHVHTVHSDGSRTLPQVIEDAQAAGLDFVNSSEHNNHSASLYWGQHVPEDFLLINGEESTTRGGHWLAVGLPAGAWVDWRFRPAEKQLQRFTDQVRGLGGLAIAAHPSAPTPAATWMHGATFEHIDAIEVWNAEWTADDQVTLLTWHSLLVRGIFKPAVGNSDTHNRDNPIGGAQTVVRASSLSVGAVVEGLKGGHSWLAESSAVDLSFTATSGTTRAECGDHLGAKPTDLVTVTLTITGAKDCVAQIVGPALIPVAGCLITSDAPTKVTVKLPAAAIKFVRAEVRRVMHTPELNPLNGVPALPMVAMTNPIFTGA